MVLQLVPKVDSNDPNALFINGVLHGSGWNGISIGKGVNIIYEIISDGSDSVPNYVENTALEVLQTWSNLSNITFTEGNDLGIDEGIKFSMSISTDILGQAPTFLSQSSSEATIISSSISISSILLPNTSDFVKGELGYSTIIHEIGHSLGLSHPNEDSVFAPALPSEYQNTDFTIMNGIVNKTGPITSQYGLPSTPQFADILAIQYLYGANYSYKSGNDIYNFSNPDVMTIWDGGGVDLIDGSGYATEVRINLNEADGDAYSTMGESAFWIAYGANIENANGGQAGDVIIGNWIDNRIFGFNGNDNLSGGDGNDFINGNRDNDNVRGNGGNDTVRGGKQDDIIFGDSGNDLVAGDRENDTLSGGSGNDILRGGKNNDVVEGDSGADSIYGDKGNDTLRGGSDADIFIFRAESGIDIIQDFEQGTDRLQFSSDIFSSSAQAISSFSNAILDLGNGNSVTLIGITSLNDADIIIG